MAVFLRRVGVFDDSFQSTIAASSCLGLNYYSVSSHENFNHNPPYYGAAVDFSFIVKAKGPFGHSVDCARPILLKLGLVVVYIFVVFLILPSGKQVQEEMVNNFAVIGISKL